MNENLSMAQSQQVDWQCLGTLEMSINLEAENQLRGWLTELLAPLNFQPELLHRIIRSASEVDLFDETRLFHFFVFILKPEGSNGNWNFFRIAKSEHAPENDHPPVSIIEFYIYNEA